MTSIHVPDYLILPFGRAVKSDLQKINLSAVSADGLYFTTDVPTICIDKSKHQPICLGEFPNYFGVLPVELDDAEDGVILDHMCTVLKSHNPNMTRWEEKFLDLYFSILKGLSLLAADNWQAGFAAIRNVTVASQFPRMLKKGDVWRALTPIPELQLYVKDPLAEKSYEPQNNFRVDYGFWTGKQLVAIEIDGAEPEGYAKDIRRDRLLRRAGVDVVHILNLGIEKYRGTALLELLPPQFFGYDWIMKARSRTSCPFRRCAEVPHHHTHYRPKKAPGANRGFQ